MRNDNRGKKNNEKSKFQILDENAIQFEKQSHASTSVKGSQLQKKKKQKNDEKSSMLKGRYICNCEAKKHALINNCLTCGRIVCEQEGSGPCYVCGFLVCTPEELFQFNGDTGKASKLYEQLLMKEKPSKALEEALKHRDKLLNYDKNTRKHTHVFDDDSDYFCATNPWLTLEQRELMKKQEEEFFNKRYESPKYKKITIDLKTQQVRSEDCKKNGYKNVDNANDIREEGTASSSQILDEDIVDHLINPFFANLNLKFEKNLKSSFNGRIIGGVSESRVIDTEIQQFIDAGYCISIHQPWSSFLVYGIKTAEGRTWFTSYRGKLWIASSASKVSRSEIEKQENTYRHIKDNVKFPTDYPFGCLLGCVDLVDCLTQEQYRHEFPDGEVEDPYVLICENPQLLPVRYPIRGRPNIYKLDEKIHKAAVMSLERLKET